MNEDQDDKATHRQSIGLRVVARSYIDLRSVRITVFAEDGAEILAGEKDWNGPIAKDGAKEWVLSVRSGGDARGKVIVRGEADDGMGVTFRDEASYCFHKDTANKKTHEGKRTKNKHGRDIIEYEVK